MTDALCAADVDAYLRRIGHTGTTRPDWTTLAALHAGHAGRIPFENLDVRWGRGVSLELPCLMAKLVHGRRGGYCFEHNGLFAAVLRAVGFAVRPLAARVRFGATRTLPRTHQLLLVDVDGGQVVADVGFGAQTLLEPIALAADRDFMQGAWRYRLAEEDGVWTLRLAGPGGWTDLYAFTLERQFAADAEMANWYVSTHPESRFVQTTTVQLATPAVRHVVQNRDYAQDRGHGDVVTQALDHDGLLTLLRETFGLALPAGVRLPLP